MYSTHDSSFTPRMVPKKPIIDGSDGLVWGSKEEELAKKKQRSKSKKGGDGKGKSKKKLAPGMTFSAANKVSTKAAAPPAPAPTQRGPASSAVVCQSGPLPPSLSRQSACHSLCWWFVVILSGLPSRRLT